MNALTVSFCLPCYNVEPYVAACIESICMQGLSEDAFEILCVDDCSTDGTYAALLELQKAYPNLRIIQNERNRGVSFSRNALIRESRGTYIWFVDPDDLLCTNAVPAFLEAAERQSADVLVGNYHRIAETDTVDAYHPVSTPSDYIPQPLNESTLPEDQNHTLMNAIWAGPMRRSFLLENHLRFHEKLMTQEDTLLYYEISVKSEKFLKVSAISYLYRQRASSVMNTHTEARNRRTYDTMLELLRAYLEHLKRGEYTDRNRLEEKIWHSRQNVAACLAALSDKSFIREQLKVLKANHIYPYRLRLDAMKGSDGFPVKLLRFLLPIQPFFWLYHTVYQSYNHRRNGSSHTVDESDS